MTNYVTLTLNFDFDNHLAISRSKAFGVTHEGAKKLNPLNFLVS